MLNNEEVKYIEDEIKKIISSASNEYFQVVMREYNSIEEEYPGWDEDWIRLKIIDAYYHILAYLEARGMPNLLQIFQSQYKEQILTRTSLLDSEINNPDGEYELKILTGFRRFLSPFKSFGYNDPQQDEFHKLVGILKNTSFIINNIKCVIAGEADIYKQVRWVLSLYYPSCKGKNKASFIKQFKTYNPDILIPELKVAIEYKYIRDKSKNIDEFIDQILVDANGYTGDHYYENFIAVFYISDAGIATPESIELAWKERTLPSNWTLVITGEGTSPRRIK